MTIKLLLINTCLGQGGWPMLYPRYVALPRQILSVFTCQNKVSFI